MLPVRQCTNPTGSRGSSPSAGIRDDRGQQIPYRPDPVRDPASSFNRNGYLRAGYDTGRTW